MSGACHKHVVFVGDSYIARFQVAIGTHPDIPTDLNLRECKISFVARRGARVETVLKIVPQICRLEPDVIFMQIGGNHVSSVSPNGVETALAIESLANEILDRSTCKALYIGELLFRFKGRYIQTDSESQYYNTSVHTANNQLKENFKTG